MFLVQLGLRDHTSLWSGLIFSINALAFAIMSPVWGSLSDRTGKKIMMARAGLGMGITYILMAFVTNHLQLLALRGINGLLAGYIPAAITLVAASSPPEHLNYSLGLVEAAAAIGNTTGPLFGGLAAKFLGIRGSMILTGLLLCVAAILPFTARVQEEIRPKAKTSLVKEMAKTFRNRQLVIIFTVWLLVEAALMAILPTLPLLIGTLSPKNAEWYTGLIFSIMGVSTALGAPLAGKIHHYSPATIFKGALLVCAVLTALQGMVSSVVGLGALRFLFGFFNAAVTVSGNVLIAKSSDPGSQGSSFGILNGIISIGSVVGPIIGGYLGDHLGLASPFFGGAVLLAVAAGLAMFLESSPRG